MCFREMLRGGTLVLQRDVEGLGRLWFREMLRGGTLVVRRDVEGWNACGSERC